MPAEDAAALAMEREITSTHGCVLIARGQIDLYSAPTFKTAFAQAIEDGMKDIVVDLSEVDFMDSTGLGVLVGVSRRLKLLGGSLAIVSPDPTIKRVFEIAGLDSRFDIFEQRQAVPPSVR